MPPKRKALELVVKSLDTTVDPPVLKWTQDSSDDTESASEEDDDFMKNEPAMKKLKRVTSPIILSQYIKKEYKELDIKFVIGCDLGTRGNLELALYDCFAAKMLCFYNIQILPKGVTLIEASQKEGYKTDIYHRAKNSLDALSTYVVKLVEDYKKEYTPKNTYLKISVALVTEKQIVKEKTYNASYHLIWLEGMMQASLMNCLDFNVTDHIIETTLFSYQNSAASSAFKLPTNNKKEDKKKKTIEFVQSKVKNLDIKNDHQADAALMVLYHLKKNE